MDIWTLYLIELWKNIGTEYRLWFMYSSLFAEIFFFQGPTLYDDLKEAFVLQIIELMLLCPNAFTIAVV